MSANNGPLPDIVAEARRVLEAASEKDILVRLIGGLAVWEHTDPLHPALVRAYKDIDLATVKKQSRPVSELMTGLGYEPAKEFNALNGSKRLLFYDVPNERQVDVFVGSFEMCHAIPITERLALEPETIPLAELLLTKLQVVELNEKDLRDMVALLHHHQVGESDDDTINSAFIASLTSQDWGLWRTVKMNLERLHQGVAGLGLSPDEQRDVLAKADALWARIEREPKSGRWKMRDRIGDRKRWYEQPDEVA